MTHLPAPLAGPEGRSAPTSETSLLRVTCTGIQTWNAPPGRVLPLLTPLGEKAWAVGWEPEMRWQAPGNGEGTLFVTTAPGGEKTVWVQQTFDAARLRVAYVHVSPGILLVELTLELLPLAEERTRAHVRYSYTALSEAGNAQVEQKREPHFAAFMRDWERELNHFLRTGRKLDEPHR